MTTINMNPGIDWTKETLVLLSNSHVEHCAVDSKDRSAHYVTVDQQWNGGGYAINDCGEYLSLKSYRTEGDFARVTGFKQNVADGKHIGLTHALRRYDCYWRNQADGNVQDCEQELRVYKDHKIVLLHKVIIDGDALYYVSTDPDNWWQIQLWGSTMCSDDTQLKLNDMNVHIVHNDYEVAQYAQKLTKKDYSKIRGNLYCEYWSDLDGRHIYNYNTYQCGRFTGKTQTTVENFLDYSSDANGYLRSEFNKHCNPCIDSINSLLSWCYLRATPATQAQTKEEHAKLLLMGLEDEWDNPEEHKNEAIWARHNNDIILIIPNQKGASTWGYGSDYKKLFAYNVQTKKRFYGEQDHNGTWTFPIPGLNYITTSLYLGTHETYYNYSQSKYQTTHTKTVIKGGLTARQLFNGSNIAWILDNTNGDCQILNNDDHERSYYNYDAESAKPVDVREYLSDNKIGTIALSILVTTGIPMLEQLLKSQLFNMYFTAIEDLENRSSSSSETFYDEDKKRSTSSEYNRKDASFIYHSKEKNLKKMFGLSINSLREINDLMVFTYGKHNKCNSREYWARPIPTIAGMAEALNSDLSAIDPVTFRRCLKLCNPGVCHSHRRYYNHSSVWSIVGDTVAQAVGENASPKQILALLENYTDCLEEYRDYLNMRVQLMHIQEVKPDIPDIYSEKRYPVKPGAAKRFMPFLHGMPDTAHPWQRTIFTEKSFVENYQNIYDEAVKRGELQVVKDNGQLLGLLVTFTPAENLKYLHDEASYWVGFYQDTAKEELFQKAIERVKPLEWTDDKSGLCILAPQGVKDLKNEASVLDHCVASYVDPIINGTENIMFLRRTDMVNSPFYTVEVLDSGEIRQVHCYRNGDLTSAGQRRAYTNSQYEVYDHDYDIVKFLLDWSKAMKGKVKASSIKSAYGALCALR